ncbi:MAG: AAA family ATPase [Candidatus Heimdallarchaeota archaeon]
MRLKRIRIDRYGPLNDLSLSMKSGIQPIYGSNESGKTLIVDFLIEKLTGKEVLIDESLQRVIEKPEGLIILEENNTEIKLEKEEILSNHLPINPDEIRNIFIIRDSDLKVTEEEKFYERVTDKLTGLRSKDIRNISEKILEYGRLTEKTRELSNSEKHKKVKTKLENAIELKKSINKYIENAAKEGIIDLEVEIYNTKSKIDQNQKELEKLKKAKSKLDYENIQIRVKKSRSFIKELEKFPDKKNTDSLAIKLEQFMKKNPKRDVFKKLANFSKWNILVSIPFSLIFWIIWSFKNIQQLGLVSPIILTIFLCFNIALWFFAFNKSLSYQIEERKLLNESKRLGLNSKLVSQLHKKLHGINRKRDKKEVDLQRNIGVIKDYLKIKSHKYEVILDKANDLLERKKQEIDFSIKMKFTEEKFDEVEKGITELQSLIESLKAKNEKHRENLRDFSKVAYKLDFLFFMNEELDLEIENFESLRLLSFKLDEYISYINANAQACKQAINIFEELELEEKSQISKLFNENSSTAKIFREITNGRYVNVFFDNDLKKIVAEKSTGELLPAYFLSKGAKDQLYLAIRIDLAQRLLVDKKGFFIMDDSLLASSRNRFKEGMKVFQDLTNSGWQIVYFTVKESDFKKICKISENKGIKLKPLE